MNNAIVRYCFLLVTVLVSMVFAQKTERHCVLKFLVCPETFNNQTISVPDNVVGIAPAVLACRDTAYIESTSTNRVSIFFVIDNSGSMSGNGASDATGARFNVTKALIDTIFQKQPTAQVGVAVFQEFLYFDTATSANFWYSKYFKTMSAVYDSMPGQAYMPLLTLNQMYDGIQGKAILDSLLMTSGSGRNVALNYKPGYTMQGRTNINIGFLAAREAFANAAAAKNNQYVVFLSDGEANRGEQDPGPDSIYYFRDSTRDVPTTFTVFFNSGSTTTVPASIRTMTQNIQANGYSTTNPSSADYAITASYSSLSAVLMSNVIGRIYVPAIPIQMIINDKSSNTYANGVFVYPDTIKFGATATTPYIMQIKYRYTNTSTGLTHDSTETINFSVRRDSTAKTPAGIALACTTITFPPVPIINAVPAHNPVGPSNPIPANSPTVNFYRNVLQHSGSSGPVNGALIGIRSKGGKLASRTKAPSENDVSYGDAVVYDAVGNIVSKNLHVYYAAYNPADTMYSYGVYWNCHNINNRWVGSGTYLVVVSTSDANNKTIINRIKVGVIR